MAGPEDFGRGIDPHIAINAFREAAQYGYPARARRTASRCAMTMPRMPTRSSTN